MSAVLMLVCCSPAYALSDQWYVGIGGGMSFLQPNPVDTAVPNNDSTADVFHLFLGRDLGELAALQIGINSLGAVDFPGASEVTYVALDASLLYRFYDSRDSQLVRGNRGISLYALVGLGAINRDDQPALDLKNNSVFFLNYGGGAELFLGRGLSLRLQGAIMDEDAQYAGLSLVARFGGKQASARPPASVTPVPGPVEPPLGEQPAQAPAPTLAPRDSDFDGIDDSVDECGNSGADFPVLANGCPRFKGSFDGLGFIPGTSQLAPESVQSALQLVNLLKAFPRARIVVLAHTDNLLEPRDQAILTRDRLKTLAGFLQSNGIRGSRLVLRSRGGASPEFDNTTAEGRELNNRIEIQEFR